MSAKAKKLGRMLLDPELGTADENGERLIMVNRVIAGSEAAKQFGVESGIFYSCHPDVWEAMPARERNWWDLWEVPAVDGTNAA